MKTKFATALSLVGVLGAGSAAALVNTQILDSGPAGADTTSILTPNAISLTVPTTPATTQPTTSAPTIQPSTTSATPVVTVPAAAPAPSGFLTSYNLAPAGVVTVDVVNGVVVIVSHTPAPGWTVVSAENKSSENLVEVHLTDGVTLVEFKVAFVNGALVPTVESSSVAATATPGNTVSNTVTRNTLDDDDDDDDHEDRDDDDDDHEDRDDDDDDDDDDHGGDDDDHDDD